MIQYLTAVTKESTLAYWSQQKLKLRPDGDPGGNGWTDPEIVPLVDALNSLPGIVTLQSCAGHAGYRGHLWIWCDATMARRLEAQRIGLRGVAASWRELNDSERRAVATLSFDGLDVSAEAFSQSASTILNFFRGLTA